MRRKRREGLKTTVVSAQIAGNRLRIVSRPIGCLPGSGREARNRFTAAATAKMDGPASQASPKPARAGGENLAWREPFPALFAHEE